MRSPSRPGSFAPTPRETGVFTAFDLGTAQLTPAIARAFKADGYRMAIIGLRYDNLPLTQQNAQVADDEGLLVEIYAYLTWGGNVGDRVKRSVDTVSAYHDRRIYLDCEDNGNGTPGIPTAYGPAVVVDKIHQAADACADFPHGMYSGPWWWPQATGYCTDFRAAPWWSADYDGVADLAVFTRYAGLTQLNAKQYAGDVTLHGIQVDLSVVRAL